MFEQAWNFSLNDWSGKEKIKKNGGQRNSGLTGRAKNYLSTFTYGDMIVLKGTLAKYLAEFVFAILRRCKCFFVILYMYLN